MNPRWLVVAVAALVLLFLGLGLAVPGQPRAAPTFKARIVSVENGKALVEFTAVPAPGDQAAFDPDSVVTQKLRLASIEGGKWVWRPLTPILEGAEPQPDKLIESFKVEPATIRKGESATLSWRCPKAKSVTINAVAVPVTGSQSVSPLATATYTLVAQAEGRPTKTAQRILTVSDTPPPTKWQVMIVTETANLDNLPRAQQAMISGLVFRQALEAKGHKWLRTADKDAASTAPEALKPWFEAASGKPLPCLLLAPVIGGDIKGYPLPVDDAAFWDFLEKGVK